jgi:hypothetical protein
MAASLLTRNREPVTNYASNFDAQPKDTPAQKLAREVALWITLGISIMTLVAMYFFHNRAQFWRIYRAIVR